MDISRLNLLTEEIIAGAIEVHRALGPGLLESAYQRCMCHELALRNLDCICELQLPVFYKGARPDCGYRVDLLVEGEIVVEIKSIEKLAPIHDAQLITYLRLGHWPIGLLLNFNVPVMKDGIRRRVLNLHE